MKNWKTSVGGILFSVGTALQQAEDQIVRHVGVIMVGAAGLLIGLFAKDNNITGVGSNARTESEL